MIEIPSTTDPVFWIFSGNEGLGYATVVQMSAQPHTKETFLACEARICCCELVPQSPDSPRNIVWIGAMSGQ